MKSNKKMNLKSLIVSLILIFLVFNNIYALNETSIPTQEEVQQLYYADIIIDVSDNGLVSIRGPTNYPKFQNIINSHEFTSKEGKEWILNIDSLEDKFEAFIFEVNFPEGTNINYIKTTPSFRISNEGERIKIIGTGEEKPFQLIVQYEIEYSGASFFMNNVKLILFLSIFIMIFISIFVTYNVTKKVISNKKISKEIENLSISKDKEKVRKVNRKKFDSTDESAKVEEVKEKEPHYDFDILPQRQKDIINILKEKGKITQKELEKTMQIPKSSVSRNVKTLEIKGIIKKESVGQTNYLSVIE